MVVPVHPRRVFTYKGVRTSEYLLNTGEGLPKHDHPHNHSTMCVTGSYVVRKQNVERVLTPQDTVVDLVANEWHELEALEDNTIVINME